MRATDELDHGTFREIHGSGVKFGIDPNQCGDTHVLGCVLNLAFALKSSLLGHLAVHEQTLYD